MNFINKSNKKNFLVNVSKNKLIFQEEQNYADIDENGITNFDFYLIGMPERISTSNCVEMAWLLSFVKEIPDYIKNITISTADIENAMMSLELPVYCILGGDIIWNTNLYNAEWSTDKNKIIFLFEEIILNWLLNSKNMNDLITNIKKYDIENIFEMLVKNKLINWNNV